LNLAELTTKLQTLCHEGHSLDEVLKDVFGVVNKGCDSEQVIGFIAKTTGHRIKEIKND